MLARLEGGPDWPGHPPSRADFSHLKQFGSPKSPHAVNARQSEHARVLFA